MRRAPIVLTATVAGTAGILAFHAHTRAVPTATASTPTVTATAKPTTTGRPRATSTPSSSGVSGTATGDAVGTQYGNAQVRVTVKAGKIVSIDALQLQGRDSRSVSISSYAAPILQQEALTKQSAAIDSVSGATFTSASYSQSLQSALDKLGFKAADGSVATLQVP
jgi:uncharacterized protein with FMN-binding domain